MEISAMQLAAQATMLYVQDQKADAAQAGDDIRRNGEVIKDRNKDTSVLTHEMNEVAGEFETVSAEVEDMSGVAKFFSGKGKKAANLGEQLTEIQGEVQLEKMETKEVRDNTKDKIAEIEDSNEAVGQQTSFMNEMMEKSAVVIKP